MPVCQGPRRQASALGLEPYSMLPKRSGEAVRILPPRASHTGDSCSPSSSRGALPRAFVFSGNSPPPRFLRCDSADWNLLVKFLFGIQPAAHERCAEGHPAEQPTTGGTVRDRCDRVSLQ